MASVACYRSDCPQSGGRYGNCLHQSLSDPDAVQPAPGATRGTRGSKSPDHERAPRCDDDDRVETGQAVGDERPGHHEEHAGDEDRDDHAPGVPTPGRSRSAGRNGEHASRTRLTYAADRGDPPSRPGPASRTRDGSAGRVSATIRHPVSPPRTGRPREGRARVVSGTHRRLQSPAYNCSAG